MIIVILGPLTIRVLQLVCSACMAIVECRTVLHHCKVIFSGPQRQWIVCCLHLKIGFRSSAQGRQWRSIFNYLINLALGIIIAKCQVLGGLP